MQRTADRLFWELSLPLSLFLRHLDTSLVLSVCFAFGGGGFVATNRIEDFPPVNRYFLRGFHPQAHLVASDLDDYDRNVISDDNALVLLTR
jgi:hypothetical protein